ncbi:MAG: hypothetical protein WDN06_11450 [Asticcacaulis sp.]
MHKRQRNRPGQKDRAKMREQRPERYDPMTAEHSHAGRGPMASTTPINFKGGKPAPRHGQNPFRDDEARGDKRPFDRKRDDRPQADREVARPSLDASPAVKRDYIAASERPRGDRPNDRKGKPGGFGGKPFAGKRGGKFGAKPGFKAKGNFKGPRPDGDVNRSEGAQFKRREKAKA